MSYPLIVIGTKRISISNVGIIRGNHHDLHQIVPQ